MMGSVAPLSRALLLLLALLTSGLARSATAARLLRGSVPAYRTVASVDDLIGALKAAGEYNLWAGLLVAANLSSLPPAATLFVPTDLAVSRAVALDMDRALVLYHISPEALPFARLRRFGVGARIPTLLPNATIVITENTTLDGVSMIRPDVFFDGMYAIHGVGSILSLASNSNAARAQAGAAGSARAASDSAAHGLGLGIGIVASALACAVLGLKALLGDIPFWGPLLL